MALSQSATPPTLDDTRKEIEHLTAEIEFLEREGRVSAGNPERVADLKDRKEKAEARRTTLEEQLKKEKDLVAKIQAKRDAIEKSGANASDDEKAELSKLTAELTAVQGENPLVYPVTHGGAVAQVVSGLTGIPMGKMVRDEVGTVLKLADILSERVVGQKHALEAIAQRIRTARADLADPRRPQGVFLLVGPSGVGKTETAMALADLLYGGDRNMVIVNMSEYKESHKVSRLVGTSKGYVGYGEGGVLTNAVKNRPYSVVLLDEVEKAHESVQEIFYQVFDKGVLQNDDGEDVNFKNTIILLTSNVGTDTIMKACADPDTAPTPAGLAEMMKADLLKAFKPALLGPHDGRALLPAGRHGAQEDHPAEAEPDRRPAEAKLQGEVHAIRRRWWTRSRRGARTWIRAPATPTTSSRGRTDGNLRAGADAHRRRPPGQRRDRRRRRQVAD